MIFTKSNADTAGRIINQKISEFANSNPDKYIFIDNLGQLRYLSVLKSADLMIGNSSSGLTEAPSFKLPVVNIGDRQKGRVKAANVIDCSYTKEDLNKAIKKALSKEFNEEITDMVNPYDRYQDGKTSHKIKEQLKEITLNDGVLKKEFYDYNIDY